MSGSAMLRWARQSVRYTLYRFGYEFYKVPITRDGAYELTHPMADYAP